MICRSVSNILDFVFVNSKITFLSCGKRSFRYEYDVTAPLPPASLGYLLQTFPQEFQSEKSMTKACEISLIVNDEGVTVLGFILLIAVSI